VIIAYIDAGTGSMALQILLAGVLSVAYAFHTGFSRLKKKIMKTKSPDSNNAPK